MKIDVDYSDKIHDEAIGIVESLGDEYECFEIRAIMKQVELELNLIEVRESQEKIKALNDIAFGNGESAMGAVFKQIFPADMVQASRKHAPEPRSQDKWVKEVVNDGDDE